MKIKIKLCSGQIFRFEGKNIGYHFDKNCLIVTIWEKDEFIKYTLSCYCFPMKTMKYFYISTKGAK